MVILDPDHVSRANLRLDRLSELEVRLAVCEPVVLVKAHFAWVVMEQGPQNGVGEAVVVPVGKVIVEVDGLAVVLFHETLVDDGSVLDGDEEAWPADPGERHGLLAA